MTYEYKCPNCQEEFERNVKVEERDIVTCDCGERAERKVSVAPVYFKGIGYTKSLVR